MAPPTWSVGQVLTADDVNTWLVGKAIDKASDQQVVSSTTLVNDTALVLAVAANATYKFECWLVYIATVGADIKWTWSVPASAALGYSAIYDAASGGAFGNDDALADTDTPAAQGSSPTVTAILMKGKLTVAGTAGNFQLKWAQNSSNSSATHVRTTSYITLDRIG
jgi:hypothetical protein